MKITRLIEYLDKEGNVVKKSKKKNLGEIPTIGAKDVFKKAMDKLSDKYKWSELSQMNLCDETERTESKMVLLIRKILVFEYDQRITFELV